MVLLYHLKGYLHLHTITASFDFLYNKGYLAVDFFFMLSGFIITFTYFEKFHKGFNTTDITIFMIKRIARIWPLHVFILCSFLLIPLAFAVTSRPINHETFSIIGFVTKLFLIDIWLIGLPHWNTWNTPSWTISGEFFAYIMFPFLVLLLKKSLVRILVTYFLLLFSIAFLYSYFNFISLGQGITKLGLFRCFSGFVIGYCIYHLYIKFNQRYESLYLKLLLVSVIVLCIYLGFNFVSNHYFIPLLFSLMLLLILLTETVVHRFLESPVLVYFGDISYSLYLNHIFIIKLYIMFFLSDESYASLLDISLIISVSLVFSHYTYQFIEIPMRKKIVDYYHCKTGKES